ncbi:TetR/AcrR family transcriptional regulator [Ligilactobacillus equi]|uniref:TetR/AcrR family transcriptional regulator n=1 Tax=Ligilactobacillus equi TaxID=137357 RepID=UPI002ED2D40B
MRFQRARTQKQIDLRLEEILKASRKLFKKQNYEKISIKTIAEATTLSRATIYTYYPTKGDIFLAILGQEYQQVQAEVAQIFAAEQNRVTRNRFCQLLTQVLLRHPTFLRLLTLQKTLIEPQSTPEHLTSFQEGSQAFFTLLSQLCQQVFPTGRQMQREIFLTQLLIYLAGFYPILASQKSYFQVQEDIPADKLLYNAIYNLTGILM